MKRLFRNSSLAFALLFLVSLALPSGARSVGTIEAYTHQTEAAVGEEIVWYASMAGWSEPFECAFFLYRDGALVAYEPPSGATVFRYAPEVAGTYTLVALGRDGSGVRAASGGSVLVGAPLRIVSVDANRPRISLGAVATWTARAEGGSGGARFGFFVYRNGELLALCLPDDPESGILNYTPEEPGTYTVDVLASDISGKAKLAGAPIVVTEAAQESEPLAVTSVSPNVHDAFVGDEIVWTATASGGMETIAFSFFLYRDGEIVSFTPVGASPVFRYTPSEPGIYSVSVLANSDTFASLESGSVTVTYPEGVRLTAVFCDRKKAALGDTITWTAQAEGASGTVAYSFALYRDWALEGLYETGASPSFSFAPEVAGTYCVEAYAKDAARSASAPSADIRVSTDALSVDSVVADALTGVVGKPVTWTVHASGGANLQYIYFVYFQNEIVFSSDLTADSSFTYIPTDAQGSWPYVLKGLVGDGDQIASFESAELPVADEGAPRLLALAPDRTSAVPGETITWTAAVDPGTIVDHGAGELLFAMYEDGSGNSPIAESGWGSTVYSYTPAQPGTYRLTVFLNCGAWGLSVEAPAVRVGSPTLLDFAQQFDAIELPDLTLPDTAATPAPTLSMSEIIVPHVDFSGVLATTRPPMAPEKPKPTPAPTLIPDLPIFEKPIIHLP